MTCVVLCCAADVAINDLTSKVTATVGGATIPFVPPVPDACKDQGLKCPLAPNVLATFKTGLTIPKIPLKDVSALRLDTVVLGDVVHGGSGRVVCAVMESEGPQGGVKCGVKAFSVPFTYYR